MPHKLWPLPAVAEGAKKRRVAAAVHLGSRVWSTDHEHGSFIGDAAINSIAQKQKNPTCAGPGAA